MGSAAVTIVIPRVEKVDGEIRVSRRRSRTIIEHSNASDGNYGGVSSTGRIELRERNQKTPLFAINPSTGVLHALQSETSEAIEE
ncbi:MAG: hypothetical protein VCB59_11280 [Gammaproteobacteria bacterium]